MEKNQNLDKNDATIKNDLENIYTDSDGQINDVSKLDIKKKSPWRYVLYIGIILILLFVAIFLLGFYSLSNLDSNKGKSVDIIIISEQNISSGDTVTYTINYKNKEKLSLLESELILRYPEGFNFINSNPGSDNQYNNVWKIGDLVAGQEGSIEVTGKLVGELGTLKILQATVSFRPENFSSSFRESKDFTSQITSSILELSIEGPDQILTEKKVLYRVRFTNTSENDLENVQIIALYPDDFVLQTSEPPPQPTLPATARNTQLLDEINNIWHYNVLESQQQQEILIEGGILSSGKDLKEVDFVVQIGFYDIEQEDFSLQLEQTHTAKFLDHNFKLDLFINGSSDDGYLNFGETLNYLIVYKNLGQTQLNNIEIIVELDSDVLDWETLADKNLGKAEDGIILWDKDSFASFSKIQPLEEGEIEFSIKTKDLNEVDTSNADLNISSTLGAIISKINDVDADAKVIIDTLRHSINTSLDLRAEGRYFSNDNIAVGTGPLPPIVGQETSLRIYWYLSNNIHEVSDIVVSTKLPEGVSWANKTLVTTGSLSYDEEQNKVIWAISGIPTNKTFEDINAWFDIKVIPDASQSGKIMLLTTDTNLEATDSVTEKKIVELERSITSSLDDDPFAAGKGVVADFK